MYVEHKPNWDKLQAISVLTSDSPYLGPALKKNPYTNHTLTTSTTHIYYNYKLYNALVVSVYYDLIVVCLPSLLLG